MTASPNDPRKIAALLHRIQNVRLTLETDRPAVAAADEVVDAALDSLAEAERQLQVVAEIVRADLRFRDEITSGDRDRDGEPADWPRYP